MRRLWGALSAGVLAASLVGCSDDPDPRVADPTSDAVPSTTTEPVTDPPESTATVEPEPESAQEFIRRYAKAEAAMENSGETEPYLALLDSCESCEALAKNVSTYYGAGGEIEWAGWTILEIRPTKGSDARFEVTVDSAPTTYRERAGGPQKRIEGGRVTYVLTLVRRGTSWLVDETAQLAS